MQTIKKYPLYFKWTSLGWISLLGDGMFYLAILSFVSTLDQPHFGILIITISETAPKILQPLLGAIGDRSIHKIQRVFHLGIMRFILYLLIGLTIIYQPNIYGILLIGILNFFSDIFGSFSSLTMMPFTKFLVKEDDFPAAMGIQQSMIMIVNIFANYLGTLLLSFVSFPILAFLNSATFLCYSLGIKLLSTNFVTIENQHMKITQNTEKNIIQHVFISIRMVFQNKNLNFLFLSVVFMNGISMSIIPLFSLFLSIYSEQIVISFPLTLTLLETTGIIGSISGSLLSQKLQRISLKEAQFFGYSGFILFSTGLFSQSLIFLFIGTTISYFFFGFLNPRLQSYIFKVIPIENIGSVQGSLSVVSIVLPSIISMLLISFSSIITIEQTSILLLIICLLGIFSLKIQHSAVKKI